MFYFLFGSIVFGFGYYFLGDIFIERGFKSYFEEEKLRLIVVSYEVVNFSCK